jgi:hypothetical protein
MAILFTSSLIHSQFSSFLPCFLLPGKAFVTDLYHCLRKAAASEYVLVCVYGLLWGVYIYED